MSRSHLLCALALTITFSAAHAATPVAAARHVRFNDGWRFLKGDTTGAEAPAFDDSKWRALTLPHDWAIEGPFDKSYNANTGGLPISGTGWYRKHFTLAPRAKGQRVSIEIDGAMSNAHVFVNGKEVGERPYGYASFALDITGAVHFDGDNVVAIRLKPEPDSSRWYPGAGLYRNVWLTVTDDVHVAHWGTYITTPEVTDARAKVVVATEIANDSAATADVELRLNVVDAHGKSVAHATAPANVAASAAKSVSSELTVASPKRWDMDTPYLYTLVTEVVRAGKVVDKTATPFGIRSIEFSREKGFLLNGRVRKLQGVCNHHDLGALGAAVNTRATERQLEIMKAMGVNAIRTSHNPPSPELLELCDRMGLVVMDEAFDMWRIAKVKNGLSKFFEAWHERDLSDMMRRDRNHPSVIMWSIGNEIPEQTKPEGGQLAKHLTDICHRVDPTRPTTAALNIPDAAIKNELAANVDVPGFNYQPIGYERFAKEHPKWVIYGSETASCVSSRGVYHLPLKLEGKTPDMQVSGFDIQAPPWAYCPDVEFEIQKKMPNLLGEFVWTGFDYLGEPTPYGGKNDWPSRSSYFGIVDLAGFPKDRFYLYRSVWSSIPTVHVLPHWNWAGKEGQTLPVMVYTNAEEVELFLNGKSLGRKKLGVDTYTMPVNKKISKEGTFVSKFRLAWDVPYAPGELKAVGYRDGKVYTTDIVKTAGAPARIVLTPDRKTIAAGGDDLSFVTVRIEDKDGNLCPLANNAVKFTVEGPATIAATDNGDASSLEPFQGDTRKAFNGLALAIVRGDAAKAGSIRIKASSDGLATGETTIEAKK